MNALSPNLISASPNLEKGIYLSVSYKRNFQDWCGREKCHFWPKTITYRKVRGAEAPLIPLSNFSLNPEPPPPLPRPCAEDGRSA